MGQDPRQLAPSWASVFSQFERPSRYKAAFGGRGSGKSHFFAEALVLNAAASRGFRAVCVREVQKTLKDSAKRLIEDKIAALGVGGKFEILNDQVRTPGGGSIIFQGMQDHTAESIKSLEGFNLAWVEEAQTLSARSLELLRPTIRAPGSELWFSWNPRSAKDPVDEFFRGQEPPGNAIIVKVNYDQNEHFTEVLEEERALDRRKKPGRYGHIWLGEYEPTAIGAIWDRATLHEGRRESAPTLERIVVAVDPAISSEEDSDEHGIVIAGMGEDQRGYVLEDATRKGRPKEWAARAIAMFDKWEADAIVVERNQGGDMVKHTLRSVRPTVPVVEVHATRGKHVRAEPISSLYETGKISHVGTFPELEDQMCKMTAAGYEGEGSPDRCDALVWALSELFPKIVEKKPTPRPNVRRRVVAGGWMGA